MLFELSVLVCNQIPVPNVYNWKLSLLYGMTCSVISPFHTCCVIAPYFFSQPPDLFKFTHKAFLRFENKISLFSKGKCHTISITNKILSLNHSNFLFRYTLGQLILALVKFCDFEIFRFSVYFNLANSWKISELEKMVSDMVYIANAIAHA